MVNYFTWLLITHRLHKNRVVINAQFQQSIRNLIFPKAPVQTTKKNVRMEGHLMSDHVHILISIPPKYSVSQGVGFIKGKSAILIARIVWGEERTSLDRVWARWLLCLNSG
jgi:REP element-mobilizing transposase RayT